MNLWQEYDCPHSFDFDLTGAEMVYLGQRFYCPGCGQEHVAGEEAVPIQTYIVRGDEMECLPMPADANALHALQSAPECQQEGGSDD